MTSTPLLEQPPRRVARVLVDVSLPHLDRLFDYEVPESMDADAVVGARVRVRFAGRRYDGWIVGRAEDSELDRLAPLEKVVSPEPVLAPQIARLVRAVADHYGGCAADVVRLAIPQRHATTEKAARRARTEPPAPRLDGPLAAYPAGEGFVQAIARGEAPRAAWQVEAAAAPAGSWARGFAQAAAAARAAGRGALLLAPDGRDLAQLEQACADVLGPGTFVVMTADVGVAARYRAFLAAERGDVDVVIGSRAAVFAPVRELGLIALWDDGDDLWSEPRAPYPHAREVACLRAAQEQAALVVAGVARTAEVQALVERDWLRSIAQDRATARRVEPVVRVAVDSDAALARDPAARAARLPHAVFQAVRAALPSGPVLVQVPRAGYRAALACQDCREPSRCPTCGGPLYQPAQGQLRCRWCGGLTPLAAYRCPVCTSPRLRAGQVGAERTTAELGRAFPDTTTIRSEAGSIVAAVGPEPALVVATPGAEPRAEAGYAAAILLDAELLLQRPELRAGEEALRRWLNAVALVRPAADGGTVVIVGPSHATPVQALVRHDPVGAAARELEDRIAVGFPPAVRMVTVEGSPDAVAAVAEAIELPEAADALGPVELPPSGRPGETDPLARLTLRAPLPEGRALVAAVKAVAAARSARKDPGALRIRVDPMVI